MFPTNGIKNMRGMKKPVNQETVSCAIRHKVLAEKQQGDETNDRQSFNNASHRTFVVP